MNSLSFAKKQSEQKGPQAQQSLHIRNSVGLFGTDLCKKRTYNEAFDKDADMPVKKRRLEGP